MLTESVVLAGAAAVVGVALATWGIRALIAAAPPGVPRLEQTRLDLMVLAFTLGVALLSAILFGVAPALRAARADVHRVIKDGGRGAGMGGVRDRLRTSLIVAELAVALVLLAGAGLLIRSSLALQRVDPGFDPRACFSARFALPAAAYPDRDGGRAGARAPRAGGSGHPGRHVRGGHDAGADGGRRQRQRPAP